MTGDDDAVFLKLPRQVLQLARTMAMNTLLVLEIFHPFFIRNIHGTSPTWDAVKGARIVWDRSNRHYGPAVRGDCLPWLQAILGSEAVPISDGLVIVGIGAAFFALIEIEKQIRCGLGSSEGAPRARLVRRLIHAVHSAGVSLLVATVETAQQLRQQPPQNARKLTFRNRPHT